jgi:hypothetical protein
VLVDHHDAIGVSKGERPEHDRVDDAEDRRVGTDAECDREHRDGRECRLFQQSSEGNAKVPHNSAKCKRIKLNRRPCSVWPLNSLAIEGIAL